MLLPIMRAKREKSKWVKNEGKEEVTGEREMREEREKVTHRTVRERSKESQAEVLWSRENLGRRNSTAVGFGGGGAGQRGSPEPQHPPAARGE